MKTIPQRIAEELSIQERQALVAIVLLDEGATVPFISRYRKELTGGLDDVQMRYIEERLHYLRELEERRITILNSIREQEKLTPELEEAIQSADTKTRLEDLYLPYRPKRRNKAHIAREAGLEPLAIAILQDPNLDPEQTAQAYLNPEKGINDIKDALEGARHVLMEKFAEEAELMGVLREYLWENAVLNAKVVENRREKGAKFADYFDYHESLKNIPSHRALALFRGRNEGVLQMNLSVGDQKVDEEKNQNILHPCECRIAAYFNVLDQGRASDKWLLETVRSAWRFKLRVYLDTELLGRLRETSETEAIKVFASNLRDLLLAAPAGSRVTMGLDPGLRTGVKVAIVDNTGKLLDHTAVYPHAPKNQWQEAITTLAELCEKHKVDLISIGNGTASRETDKLVGDLIKQRTDLNLHKIVVSEAGASVYSASELASQEFPELDTSIRGAISIARRLQDPLAELVKIEPKSIGVGQYQHDVSQTQLARNLDAVVEDCVNAVGVDLNTASVPLLSRVSGLNSGLARNIVTFREENGIFSTRDLLKTIPRFGEKTFEQAAGFLRITNAQNPLDGSSVHPEAYPVVERIAERNDRSVKSLIGDTDFLHSLNLEDYIDERFGIPTVTDILRELEKPGRDPRPEFKTAHFKEGVENLEDLEINMMLEGIVTNVTDFGAFVDIGVHQDGLVHISELSHSYVKKPRDVVKAGDIVNVKVLEIDLQRRRVALSMRLEEKPSTLPGQRRRFKERENKEGREPSENRESRGNREGKESNTHKPRRGNKRGSQDKHEKAARVQKPKGTATGFVGIMAEAFANARKR